jgi:hypothetical protein
MGCEELGAKLQIHQLYAAGTTTKGRALDQVKVIVSGPARGIAPSVPNRPWFGPVPPSTLIGIEKYDALLPTLG